MKRKLLFRGGISAILLIVVVTGWFAFDRHSKKDPTCTLNVPVQIASLSRTELISGTEAIQQIVKMHGKNISLEEGHIAKYQSGGTKLTLWISISPTSKEGETLFRLMNERMPVSKVFSNRQELEIGGKKVFKVVGMGQEHYYWVSGKYNYWIALGGTEGKTIVEDLMLKVE